MKIQHAAILFLLLLASVQATVTFTQTSDPDFNKGYPSQMLIGGGQVTLPNQATDFANWATTTDLPQILAGHKIVTWNDYAYLIGGYNGVGVIGDVYRAPIDEDGIGTWSYINSLPEGRHRHAVVVGGGIICSIGGMNSAGDPTDQLFYAELDADGNLGGWQTSAMALPQPLWGHTAEIADGNLYVMNGVSTAMEAYAGVFYAPSISINWADAPTGFTEWVTPATSCMGSSAVDGHTIYQVGGYNSLHENLNSVRFTSPDLDGVLAPWTDATPLPNALHGHSVVITNGKIVVIAGNGDLEDIYSKTVYQANLSDAPNFNWLETYELYNRRSEGAAFVSDGQIIYTGGYHIGGEPLNAARYSSLSMGANVVTSGRFVSYPFTQLGDEMDLLSISYNLALNNELTDWGIFFRTAGNDLIWSSWIPGQQQNPTPINLNQRYVQYMFNFSTVPTANTILNDVSLNVVGTQISGDLNSLDSLVVRNSPYWATADVSFTAGEHYIEPGVTVMFSPNTGLEIGQASIMAAGVDTANVVFTSYNDQAGLWNGIWFTDSSDNLVTSEFHYTIFEMAGNGPRSANLYFENSSQPLLQNCIIREAVGHGISFLNSSPSLNSCAILENSLDGLNMATSSPILTDVNIAWNGGAGLYYADAGINPTFAGCTVTGNYFGIYAPSPDNSFEPPEGTLTLSNNTTDMAIGGGTITADRTWAFFEQGIAVLGDITIQANTANPRLTIAAGNILKFAEGAQITVGGNSTQGGELFASGTAPAPITFTALTPSGTWGGLVFQDGSDYAVSTSLLYHCTIEKAVNGNITCNNTDEPHILNCSIHSAGVVGLDLNSSDITIEETDIADNGDYGIRLNGSAPSLVTVNILNSSQAGIYVPGGSANFNAFNCSIVNCNYGISIYSPNVSFLIDGSHILFSNNIVDGVAIPGGTVNSDQTWGLTGADIVVLGSIYVAYINNFRQLTILPGSTLKFVEDSHLQIGQYIPYANYGGALQAVGTEEMPITFTSLNAQTGGWNGIYFHDNSDNYAGSDSQLEYCIIERSSDYGLYSYNTTQPTISNSIIRHTSEYGIFLSGSDIFVDQSRVSHSGSDGIHMIQSDPEIVESEIQNSTGHGIYLEDSSPVLTNNAITGSTGYALYCATANSFPNTAGNVLSGNQLDVIAHAGGYMTDSGTWYHDGFPHVIQGDIIIQYINNYRRLTIEPGTTMRFVEGGQLQIGNYIPYSNYGGELYAVGTADQPITFTADNDTPGGWDGIYFHTNSDNYDGQSSLLEYCIIEMASASAVYCHQSNQPTMSNMVIRNNTGYGLNLFQSDIALEQSEVYDNQSDGLYLEESDPAIGLLNIHDNLGHGINMVTASPELTDNTISNNGGYGLYCASANSFPHNTGNILTGNLLDAIVHNGGGMSVSGSWYHDGYDHIILGDLVLQMANNICTLTIDPGCTLKFAPDVKLQVANYIPYSQYGGELIAVGTEDLPITFTALTEDGETWSGLVFHSNSDNYGAQSVLEYCVIRHGLEQNIYCDDTNTPLLKNSIISDAVGHGLNLLNTSLPIQQCQIINNGDCGVYVGGSGTTIGDALEFSNDLFGNTNYDVYNASTGEVNARHNYWGTVVPTEIDVRIYDQNDNGSVGPVIYDPPAPTSIIGNLPPDVFSLVQPGDGAVLSQHHPEFFWHLTADANQEPLEYQLQITTDPTWEDFIYSDFIQDTSHVLADTLEGGLWYWWRVRVRDVFFSTYSAETWTFAFSNQPTAPNLLSPPSGSSMTGMNYLAWELSSDPDLGDNISAYRVQIDTDLNFTAPAVDEILPVDGDASRINAFVTRLDELADFSNLLEGQSYYWRVSALDSFGVEGDFSIEPFYFSLGTTGSAPPVALSQSVITVMNTPLPILLSGITYIESDLTYEIGELPQFGTLTGTVPQITYTPGLDWLGQDFFTFRVSDTGNTSHSATVTIQVIPPNLPPVLDYIGLITMQEDGDPAYRQLLASDPQDDLLTFSVIEEYDEINAGIEGDVLTVTSGDDVFGYFDIVVTVSDGELTDSEIVPILIYPVNDAPILGPYADQYMLEDTPHSIDLVGNDIDNMDLLFTATTDQGNMDLVIQDGVLTFIPAANWYGLANITLTVSDLQTRAIDSNIFWAIVEAVNDAPMIDPIGDHFMFVNTVLDIPFTAGDIEGDELLITASSSNTNVVPSIVGESLVITPLVDWFGNSEITLTVDDGEYAATTSFQLTIINLSTDGYGCTDPVAINYDPAAIIENGSCIYYDPQQAPVITAVADVPQDQGLQLNVVWDRAYFDYADPGNPLPIAFYSLWRLDTVLGDTYWSQVGQIQALQLDSYSYTAPALLNALPTSYQVVAHTMLPWVTFSSNVLSGTAIDNLAPAIPTGLYSQLAVDQVMLWWEPAAEPDFQYYTIYRDEMMIANGVDPYFEESFSYGSLANYRLSATDFNGNESELSTSEFVVNGILGDSNADLAINVLDIVVTVENILAESATPYQFWAGDFNSDGELNVIDVVILVEYILDVSVSRGAPLMGASLTYGDGQIMLDADGSVAGLELEVEGEFTVIAQSIPPGWEFYGNDQRLLLISMDGSTLSHDMVLSYQGDLKILNNLLTDWSGNALNAPIIVLPEQVSLQSICPNPFNPTTTISYAVSETGIVELAIYDIRGRLVETLQSGQVESGTHQIQWQAAGQASGIYLVVFRAGDVQDTRKIILLK